MSDVVQTEARNCRCLGGGEHNADTAKPERNREKLMAYLDSAGSKTPTHYFSRIYLAPGRAGGGGGTLERAQGPGRKAGKCAQRCAGPLVGP